MKHVIGQIIVADITAQVAEQLTFVTLDERAKYISLAAPHTNKNRLTGRKVWMYFFSCGYRPAATNVHS